MVAWRWNDGVELVPYVHVAGGRDFDFKPVVIYPGEEVKIVVDVLNGHVAIGDEQYFIPTNFFKGWFINAWFGGNCPAPHKMRIEETKNAALQSGDLETTDPGRRVHQR